MNQLTTIDLSELETVTGGEGEASMGSRAWGFAKGAGRVATKVGWPIAAGMALVDGYQGYNARRGQGGTVGESLGAGAQNAASGATLGLIPPPQ